MPRQLIFHLGDEHTGAAVLRSWLTQHQRDLATQGVYYPLTVDPGESNAADLLQTLRSEPVNRVCLADQFFGQSRLLLSGNSMMWDSRSLAALKQSAQREEIELQFVVLVRDLLPYCYSRFEKSVGKGANTDSLETFLAECSLIDQLDWVTTLYGSVSNVHLLHYNTEDGRWLTALLDLLQLTFDEPVSLETSGRWLQMHEISLIQRFVTWQHQYKRLLPKHNLARGLGNWFLQQSQSQTAVKIESALVPQLLEANQSRLEQFNRALGKRHGFELGMNDGSILIENSATEAPLWQAPTVRPLCDFLVSQASTYGEALVPLCALELASTEPEIADYLLGQWWSSPASVSPLSLPQPIFQRFQMVADQLEQTFEQTFEQQQLTQNLNRIASQAPSARTARFDMPTI